MCSSDLYYSHIYLNPYDGKIAPYYAPSMYQKYVYKNVPSLIAARRPEMLPSFESAVEAAEATESTALILAQSKERHDLTQLRKDEIDTYNALVQDTSMYAVSNRLKLLQAVYDHGLVVVWYDNVLPHNEIEAAYKQPPSSAVGESVKMKNGMMATVTADYGYKDITIQFEDGTIREHCRRDKFRAGSIAHPTRAITCSFRAHRATSECLAFSGKHSGKLITESLVLTEHVTYLTATDSDISSRNVGVGSDMSV